MAATNTLVSRLRDELDDATIAQELAALLAEDTLSWTAPEVVPDRIGLIIAYTFGNRMLASGNRLPGPVNEALADIAAVAAGGAW